MKNNAKYEEAVKAAEKAVRDAEVVMMEALQHSEDVLNAVEAAVFKGAEGVKDTRAGDTILHNVLCMLTIWHEATEADVLAEIDLSEKQAVLKQLLSM